MFFETRWFWGVLVAEFHAEAGEILEAVGGGAGVGTKPASWRSFLLKGLAGFHSPWPLMLRSCWMLRTK